MYTWFPIVFFIGMVGLIATAVVGWDRENRRKAKQRAEAEKSQPPAQGENS